LFGCGGPFLDDGVIKKMDVKSPVSSEIIYYEESLDYSDTTDVHQKYHIVTKFGSETQAFPEILQAYDNSIFRLVNYHARLLDTNGERESYSKAKLLSIDLSSGERISKSHAYFLGIKNSIKPGDILETVAEYKYELPQLGVILDESPSMSPNTVCRYVVKVPARCKIQDALINGFPKPVTIAESNGEKTVIYSDTVKEKKLLDNPFRFKNTKPRVLLSFPVSEGSKENLSWVDFGDWYLDMFEAKTNTTEKIRQTTLEVTKDAPNEFEKLRAIFQYIEKKVRYEQVYLMLGEFIPNECELILSHGYGDCKDYSTLIYAMAKSIGIKTYPVLCFRGRGKESFENLPVAQFNHMIIYYPKDGKDYWLDGTNRSGEFGITTSDLMNQDALILEKGNSRIKRIECLDKSSMQVTGELAQADKDLRGTLLFHLSGQYAADFYLFEYHLNTKDYTTAIHDWLGEFINPKMSLENLEYKKVADGYDISAACLIPNALVKIDTNYYSSLQQIFPLIISPLTEKMAAEPIEYYPKLSNVQLDIKLKNLRRADEANSADFVLKDAWKIDIGPYYSSQRDSILAQLKKLHDMYTTKIKLQVISK
jgi:hypothetical protein